MTESTKKTDATPFDEINKRLDEIDRRLDELAVVDTDIRNLLNNINDTRGMVVNLARDIRREGR